MSGITEEVDRFIRRLHDMDYRVTLEATQLWFSPPSTFPSLALAKRRTLSDNLANAIAMYQENRDDERVRLRFAQECSVWINKAFSCGVIEEGLGLARKLEECEEMNTQLKTDLKKLSIEHMKLRKEHEEVMKGMRGVLNKDDLGRKR